MLQNARLNLLLPENICPDAALFWYQKGWLSKTEVPFRKFFSDLYKFLNQHPAKWKTRALRRMLVVSEDQTSGPVVKLERFSKILMWFGALRLISGTIFDRIEACLRESWFFGEISTTGAEHLLDTQKYSPGTFLVRLNLGGSEGIETSPFTISKISTNGLSHIRVYHGKDGKGLRCKVRVDGKFVTLKSPGTIRDLINVARTHYPLIFAHLCPGHPYSDVFMDQSSKLGKYESANKEAEPESDSDSEPSE
jgi:hypothetical protein